MSKSRTTRAGIRACVDRLPPPDQAARFARLARGEDPTNVIVGVDVAPSELAFFTAKKWQNGRTLRVAFMGGTKVGRRLVQEAADEISKHANLKFTFVTGLGESDLRFAFNRSGGAWSYIGTDCAGIAKDQPTGNLGWDDLGTAIHELMHGCGCIHEHQSPAAGIPWDLPAVYRYYGGPPNHWDKETIDHNVIKKYGSDVITQFTKFDPKSIMLYPVDQALVTDPSFATGWNTELSPTDKKFLVEIYPAAGPPPTSGVTLPATGSYRITDAAGKKSIVFE